MTYPPKIVIARPIAIYVVDDEPVISRTLAIILRHAGFDARAFDDPVKALAYATRFPPDLLVTDVSMPGMTGVELAMQLRAHCPMCNILLFSAEAGSRDLLQDARSLGHEFLLLEKPVHPTQLLNFIGPIVQGRSL